MLRRGAISGVEALLCEAPRCATATAGGDSGTQVWAIRRELFLSAHVAARGSDASAALSASDALNGRKVISVGPVSLCIGARDAEDATAAARRKWAGAAGGDCKADGEKEVFDGAAEKARRR